MAGAEFNLKLVDMVSGPASKMGEALAAIVDPATMAVAAVGAMTAAGAVVGAALLEGAKEAVEASEALRKLTAQMDALSGGSGKQVVEQLDAMRASLGLTREQMAPMASQLLGMGIRTSELADQMKALASVQAIGVNGGTEEYLTILRKIQGESKISAKTLENLYKTGVNVADIAGKMGMSVKDLQTGLKNGTVDAKKFGAALTQAVTSKGAGALAAQAESLTSQWAVFKENISDLFTGVDASPFLDALKSVLELFGQNTNSGKAMKAGITGLFNEVFKLAAKVIPYLRKGIEYLIIGGLKVYIMLKQHWSQIAPVLKAVAIGFGIIVGAIAAVVAIGIGFVAFVTAIPVAIVAALGALQMLATKGLAALADWAKSGVDMAKQFVDGLISGITGGVSKAVDSVKNLGSSMLDGVKNVLGIHSPSAEMAKLGGFTAQGFAKGVGAANAAVMAAGADLGGAVQAGAAAPSGGGSGGGGTYAITINVAGGSGTPQQIADATAEAVTDIFERLGLMQGVGTAA